VKYIVAYTTENSDLYTEDFESRSRALYFISHTEDKCILIGPVPNATEVEDHT
jgi:hypothetical protein